MTDIAVVGVANSAPRRKGARQSNLLKVGIPTDKGVVESREIRRVDVGTDGHVIKDVARENDVGKNGLARSHGGIDDGVAVAITCQLGIRLLNPIRTLVDDLENPDARNKSAELDTVRRTASRAATRGAGTERGVNIQRLVDFVLEEIHTLPYSKDSVKPLLRARQCPPRYGKVGHQ